MQCKFLSFLLTPYHPAHTLHSSDQLLLQRFPTQSNFGSCAFCSAAPSVWNSLPYPVRASRTLSSFKLLSKLTISSLPFTHPSTSRPHQRLRFSFRHWRLTNLHYYYFLTRDKVPSVSKIQEI